MYLLTPPPPPPLLEPTGPLSRALTTRTLLDHVNNHRRKRIAKKIKFHAQQQVKVVTQVPTIAMSCHLPSTLSDRGDASTDFEITVGNVKYLLTESQKVNNFLLLKFLECADFDNDNALREFQASTLNRDDVYQPDFASNMVFYGFSEEWRQELAPNSVVPRPYVISRGITWQSWRVYHDFQRLFHDRAEALAASRWKMSDSSNEDFCPRYEYFGTLVAVNAAYAAHNGRVIVPSRCYYKPSKDRPLAGARFSVKDNIDVAGQKTTLCNRAWTEFISVHT
ncbi:amidase-like protein [Beauveria bassiana ARSEF 2860]|uniref:Amidase-like protein n=1 Tax=Beauveria bassiana (strain ARSEF 2860) TaxID=655819 RepID=J5JXZ3_BEAB2|nr:amidase-like protein [Beauveria bassiana ARSEF 2860]EJP69348.1 amidase-like protein [Beauveria bassiana ARSEF 2860]